ncbi:MAG: hypothetical protein KDA29_00310 [Phycisphaerales bacterium]|nr:hypothetical protein [Phycisphaerales bacterium]
MLERFTSVLLCTLMLITRPALAQDDTPLRLAIIGLDHGYVEGVLWNATSRDDLTIVGELDFFDVAAFHDGCP